MRRTHNGVVRTDQGPFNRRRPALSLATAYACARRHLESICTATGRLYVVRVSETVPGFSEETLLSESPRHAAVVNSPAFVVVASAA